MVLGAAITLLVVSVFGRGLLPFLAPPVPAIPTFPPLVLPTPAPTPTPKIITSGDVIRQIRQLSRLETTAYSVQTVVVVERPGNVIGIGRQRLLLIVHGNVVAGIDLQRLRPQDVTVSPDGKKVTIRLPEAEILSSALDETKTQIYDFQTGLFTRPDTNLIVEAQKAGAGQILRTACQDGILQRATTYSQLSLRQLLELVGFESIVFEETPVPACQAPAAGTPPPPAGTPSPAPSTATPGR
jgi:hypothetical protein